MLHHRIRCLYPGSQEDLQQDNRILGGVWPEEECAFVVIEITDGMFTYYMIENMALSTRMT